MMVISSCKTRQNKKEQEAQMERELMEAIERALAEQAGDTLSMETDKSVRPIYNASATRVSDIIHTKLEVSFNIPESKLYGKAWLRLKPYFYASDSLFLDAKAFDIHRIALQNKQGDLMDLNYVYSNNRLAIGLDKIYNRNEEYQVYVHYTANPERVTQEGSSAISSAKGLYFIDPKNEDPDKPTQIWTQGETESNSCWFPTIDKPNERMTHELFITVHNRYKTLSNGILKSSKLNSDSLRTDHWVMDIPHAPYLVMMAIGEYAVVKDKWGKIDVDYYVEKEFEPYAKNIFGNTPEMLGFFSQKLGVNYPWQKYAQVVVRDYVSGAMENTSATIFGEFVQQTDDEQLDQDFEDVIAHELFHHWFGDLVTCESWANLPLNESFATYGEYLWMEHKYGKDAAHHHLMKDLSVYFEESFRKKVDLIRFDYEKREDMFDRHSYQKGGCVLHMLRKYVGDEAFFESLKVYLTKHAGKAVEIHELRLAFEEVTGEDLNWFFNQWFLGKGHPFVDVTLSWNPAASELVIDLSQTQDLTTAPLFRLPLDVDMYVGAQPIRKRILLDSLNQRFRISLPAEPRLVIVDAEYQLVGKINQSFSPEDIRYMYLNVPHLGARMKATESMIDFAAEPGASELFKMMLRDEFWAVRLRVLQEMETILDTDKEAFYPLLLRLAKEDEKSKVRAEAITVLGIGFAEKEDALSLFESALKDKSPQVQSAALGALYQADPERTLVIAKSIEKTAKGDLLSSIAAIYATSGVEGKFDLLKEAYKGIRDPNDKYLFIQLMGRYALSQDDELIETSTAVFEDISKNASAWWLRLSGIQVLAEMMGFYEESINQTPQLTEDGIEIPAKPITQQQTIKYKQQSDRILAILNDIRETEQDPYLRRLLNIVR